MDPKILSPVLMTAAVAFLIYRRVRRNIGRQKVRPSRMIWRAGIFAIIGVLVFISSVYRADLAGAMALGLGAGVALAWFGLRHTKFEVTDKGVFYTPHTYIGLFVSVLFLARIAYRFIVVYPLMQAASQANANPLAAYQKSPLTMIMFGLLIGYYIAYYAGVLMRSRDLAGTAPTPATIE